MAQAQEQVRDENELEVSRVLPSPGSLNHEGCISQSRAKGQPRH